MNQKLVKLNVFLQDNLSDSERKWLIARLGQPLTRQSSGGRVTRVVPKVRLKVTTRKAAQARKSNAELAAARLEAKQSGEQLPELEQGETHADKAAAVLESKKKVAKDD